MRDAVSARDYEDYLEEISAHHSIPVMDREVDRFLERIARNGLVVDVSGCWGWHWRRISNTRPDVTVFIGDFIRKILFTQAISSGRKLDEISFSYMETRHS